MSEKQQEDLRDNSITVVIKQTGLPSTLKGHAQRILIRWLAGTIAHPYFQTVRDNLDTIEGRSRVNMMLADEVGRQAIADPAQLERAKARFLGDTYRKQENVEAVAVAAAAKIEEQTSANTEAKPTAEPSADFMNAFTAEAENASSDQLRERLASILAGEIKNPGTFSRSVIRLASEIEQDALQQFQQVLTQRVGDYILPLSSWNSGDMFVTALNLNDLGLISGTGGISHSFNPNPSRNGFLIGSEYGMVVTVKSMQPIIQTNVWMLTKIGVSFASLLSTTDERIPLRKLANEIDKSNIEKIIVGKVTPLEGKTVNVSFDEYLYTDPIHLAASRPHGLVSIPSPIAPTEFRKT